LIKKLSGHLAYHRSIGFVYYFTDPFGNIFKNYYHYIIYRNID